MAGADVEAQRRAQGALETDNPAYSSTHAAFYLSVWLVNNIAVTLLNKAAFKLVNFEYPLFLSAAHMAVNYAGAVGWGLVYGKPRIVVSREAAVDPSRRRLMLVLFSWLFSANICIGNVSLQYVSVNFNQVMRSLVPAFVMAMGALGQGKRFSRQRTITVIPVVAGVMMAVFADMQVNTAGILVTALCVLLASAKAVLSGIMLTGAGLQMTAMELLREMAPMSMCWMLLASYSTGELGELLRECPTLAQSWAFPVVFLSAVSAFTFNVSSFVANKVSSPLTLTIWGNFKQVLLIILSTIIFSTPVSFLNGTGIGVVIVGSGVYNYISVVEKEMARSSG